MPNSDYRCAMATSQDRVDLIAKYIHLTDPYIYPAICQDPADPAWITLISECLAKEDNIFSLRNISVITHHDEIIGIACTVPCGKCLTFAQDIAIPLPLRNSILPVIRGYFQPLLDESYAYSGYNIANVCIDPKYRGKGAGAQLMAHCIRQYGTHTMHLDVIAANTAAIKLYEKSGFVIADEYLGFSGDDTPLPCYHMIRKAEF